MELLAVAVEARRTVRYADGVPPVVGQAEAALVVAHAQREVLRGVKLVVVEAQEVPVVMRWRNGVVQLARCGLDAHAAAAEPDALPHLHDVLACSTRAADPEDAGAAIVDERREPEAPERAVAHESESGRRPLDEVRERRRPDCTISQSSGVPAPRMRRSVASSATET